MKLCLGAWSQDKLWLPLLAPRFGYFAVFGPVSPHGPFLGACGCVPALILTGWLSAEIDKFIYLGSLFLLFFLFFPPKMPALGCSEDGHSP